MMNIHVRLLMFHSMLYAILIAREFFFSHAFIIQFV